MGMYDTILEMKSLEEKFWERVNKNGPIPSHRPKLGRCWIWIGSISTDGYGKLNTKRAHRISFEIHKGKIPKGKLICHDCDNILCIRPSHIFAGTQKENVADMMAKHRERFIGAPKLTEAQVIEIRTTPPYRGMQMRFAEKFGVDQSTISDALHRVSFKNL